MKEVEAADLTSCCLCQLWSIYANVELFSQDVNKVKKSKVDLSHIKAAPASPHSFFIAALLKSRNKLDLQK